MKQFSKIFSFELKGHLRNKTFIVLTAIMMAVALAVTSFPRIMALFEQDGGSEEEEKERMLIYAEQPELAGLIQQYFTAGFSYYQVEVFNGSEEEMKEQIRSGLADCGFRMNSVSSYIYYVDDLSLYDENTVTAELLLQEVGRVTSLMGLGFSAEEAATALTVEVKGECVTLGKDQQQTYFYTYFMVMGLYMAILLYGQKVATDVASEKSSRAMELLVTSADPTAMMFGKVMASCAAGLLQLVLIFGTAIGGYKLNEEFWEGGSIIDSLFNIPGRLLGFMLLFFLLGFFLFAFLYGAVGSTVSKLEDVGTAVQPITFVFLGAFMIDIIGMTGGNVDGPLMKICSFLPFTSPMVMFTRLCMSTVPVWEQLLSVGLLAAAVFLAGKAAAKIYRIGVLMYGNSPKFKEILKMLKQQ